MSTTRIVEVVNATANPVPVAIVSGGGGGGGGGGDASAANQLTQIAAEQSLVAAVGTPVASPAANTVLDRLKALITALGNPFQEGGSIANTAFGIDGDLPAFEATALGQKTRSGSLSVTVASDETPIPTIAPDVLSGTGTITTQNLTPSGVATAGSMVGVNPNGRSGLTIQVTGTYTGALNLQGTVDGVNWVTIGGTPLINAANAVVSGNIGTGAQGIWQTDCSGFEEVRITALAAVTGTANVTLRATADPVAIAVNRPLPGGLNLLGLVTQIPQATVGGYATRNCVVSAAGTNGTLLKNAQGTVGRIVATNTSAAIKYVSLFSKVTAPVPGTDTPVFKFGIPAGQCVEINSEVGMRIAAGIGFGITGGAALLDNTAVAAGDVILNIEYV